jgi:hypothetical protein
VHEYIDVGESILGAADRYVVVVISRTEIRTSHEAADIESRFGQPLDNYRSNIPIRPGNGGNWSALTGHLGAHAGD